jgi:hypothetical protein
VLFVSVRAPGCPFDLYCGVAYLAPNGSARAELNRAVLDELELRSLQYARSGMVLVMGDFNVHVGCATSCVPAEEAHDVADWLADGRALLGDSPEELRLTRDSVDKADVEGADGISVAGRAFMHRLECAGLVLLNGLTRVGDGARAEATYGERSVIDFILADAALAVHGQCACGPPARRRSVQ